MTPTMSFRLLAALAAAAALLPHPAEAGGSFDGIATSAERVDALEPFLAGYVGKCTDPYARAECERNLAARRRAVTGKTFTVRVSDAAALVRPQLNGDAFVLLVTPFVDGGGLALSHGVPAKQDAAGNPLVNLIPIRGELAPGQLEMEFQSPFRVGAIELEIVFRPERAWKLPRHGEPGQYEGVAARFLGVRVLDARTGAEIASKVL
jgi:hypothetical protein